MGNEQQPAKKSSTGLDENLAGLLCYLGWWVTGIIFLVIEKDSKTVKFHAWQSIITFGGITVLVIVGNILGFIPVVGFILRLISGLLWLAGVIAWILLMYKAFSGEQYKLPYVGDLAEKQAGN